MDAITLHRLKILVMTAEQGSFNRAAQVLLLTQSAVSQHVQELEAALGIKLFERSSRGVRPTPAGTKLIDYARKILALVTEAHEAVVDVDSAENQTLTIGATAGVSVYILPPWMRRFQETHPTINLSQQTGRTGDVIAGVLEQRVDFGLAVGEVRSEPKLNIAMLDTILYHLIVNPEHRWAQRDFVHVNELSAEPYLNRQPASRSRRWLDAKMQQFDVRLNNAALFNTPGAIKYALFSNMGVSILPAYVVERELQRGDLVRVAILDDHETPVTLERELKLLWRSAESFRAVQQAFLDIVAPHLL